MAGFKKLVPLDHPWIDSARRLGTCLGVTDEELVEGFNVALVVGGSIVIPHLRRAFAYLDAAREALDGENRLRDPQAISQAAPRRPDAR